MSTSAIYPNAAANWKQEVNQRLAAHRNRRNLLGAQPAEATKWSVSRGRGSLVAARVAARYASAPSYSQLQDGETPTETLVAWSAPLAVVEPRVEVSPVPRIEARTAETDRASAAEWEAALSVAEPWTTVEEPAAVHAPYVSAAPPERTPIAVAEQWSALPALAGTTHRPPESLDDWESEYAQNVWHPDPGMRPVTSDVVRSPRPTLMNEFSGAQGPVAVEPDLPIHANLIEFPREVVAARKMRPRRAERSATEGMDRQLSIFEVDPGVFPASAVAEPTAAAAWTQPEWSGIRLEAHTQQEERREEPSAADVHLAPVGHRLMAVLVDGALISAVFVALSFVAAAGLGPLPTTKIAAFGVVAMLLTLGMVYQALFLLLAGTTPGMKYAGISLCTFDGQIPTPAELRSRLGGLLLSVAPMGLGLAWALFDEDHLCWHDRLSGTYLRKE